MQYKLEFDQKSIAERKRAWLAAKDSDINAAYKIRKRSEKDTPFAYGICAYKLFWLFVIASIIGVILETASCFLLTGHLEMRTSFVLGMFIPVYGIGAVAMTLSLHKLYKLWDIWIFLGSAVIGGAVEYFCSLFQQLAFNTVSWNYSDTQFNFNGRTNLTYSFIWGILGIVWVKNWYPKISRCIEKIPKKLGKLLTIILSIILVIDIILSSAAVTRKVERFNHKPASNSFEVFLDRYFDDAYLNFVFPHMEIPQKRR